MLISQEPHMWIGWPGMVCACEATCSLTPWKRTSINGIDDIMVCWRRGRRAIGPCRVDLKHLSYGEEGCRAFSNAFNVGGVTASAIGLSAGRAQPQRCQAARRPLLPPQPT